MNADPRTKRGLLALLDRHGLRLSKGLGQHFLVDRNLLAFIVRSAGVVSGQQVYEIGPGAGGLTLTLIEAGARVTAIEKDRRLAPLLREVTGGKAELVFADALAYTWEGVPEGSLLVANLPYNVATPLILGLLSAGRFSRLVVMVQREVAARFSAGPGSRDYGPLALKVRHMAGVERLRDVPPAVFFPPPEVTSSVIRLTPTGVRPDPGYFAFLDAAFRNRRKTLRKNLEASGYGRGRVLVALTELGLEPQVRAEALSPEALRALYARLTRPPSTR